MFDVGVHCIWADVSSPSSWSAPWCDWNCRLLVFHGWIWYEQENILVYPFVCPSLSRRVHAAIYSLGVEIYIFNMTEFLLSSFVLVAGREKWRRYVYVTVCVGVYCVYCFLAKTKQLLMLVDIYLFASKC